MNHGFNFIFIFNNYNCFMSSDDGKYLINCFIIYTHLLCFLEEPKDVIQGNNYYILY